MKIVLSRCVTAGAFAAILCIATALSATAQTTKTARPAATGTSVPTAGKPPSDKFLDFLQTIVTSFLIPEEIERKDGTKIKIDRSDQAQMKSMSIPREDMRRIVHIGFSGAIAETCERADVQNALFQWLKRDEHRNRKWSELQTFYVSQVYWGTIMALTQRADLRPAGSGQGQEGAAEPPSADVTTLKQMTCTESKKKFVKILEDFLVAESKS